MLVNILWLKIYKRMFNFGCFLIIDNKNYFKIKLGYVKIYILIGEVGSIFCFIILVDYFVEFNDYDK